MKIVDRDRDIFLIYEKSDLDVLERYVKAAQLRAWNTAAVAEIGKASDAFAASPAMKALAQEFVDNAVTLRDRSKTL